MGCHPGWWPCHSKWGPHRSEGNGAAASRRQKQESCHNPPRSPHGTAQGGKGSACEGSHVADGRGAHYPGTEPITETRAQKASMHVSTVARKEMLFVQHPTDKASKHENCDSQNKKKASRRNPSRLVVLVLVAEYTAKSVHRVCPDLKIEAAEAIPWRLPPRPLPQAGCSKDRPNKKKYETHGKKP